MEAQEYDVERLRGFIKRCQWRWARTMPNIPHEYIYNGRCNLTYDEFMYFLYCQVNYGKKEYYGKRLISYLYIDGYKYWTMGIYEDANKTMNRQKIFYCYDDIADRYDSIRDNKDCELQNKQIGYIINNYRYKIQDGSIFDIGAGTGILPKIVDIEPRLYQGIEPSKNMIDIFRMNNPNYKIHIRRKALEEDGLSFKIYDNVIALFGSGSYIMHQYLERLADESKAQGIFLMFFNESWGNDFLNESGKCIPHFTYHLDYLRGIFNTCEVVGYNNYYIVTNYKIDWQKVLKIQPKEEVIQTSLF